MSKMVKQASFNLVPYIVMFCLLIRGITLPGASRGIKLYLQTNFAMLVDGNVWFVVATQVFFSMGPGFGVLLVFASYNKLHTYMSCKSDLPVKHVAIDGPSLMIVVYPEVPATKPSSTFWSLLFFLMLITLGLDSSFGGSETIVTPLRDEFSWIRRHPELFIALLFSFYILVGLLMCWNFTYHRNASTLNLRIHEKPAEKKKQRKELTGLPLWNTGCTDRDMVFHNMRPSTAPPVKKRKLQYLIFLRERTHHFLDGKIIHGPSLTDGSAANQLMEHIMVSQGTGIHVSTGYDLARTMMDMYDPNELIVDYTDCERIHKNEFISMCQSEDHVFYDFYDYPNSPPMVSSSAHAFVLHIKKYPRVIDVKIYEPNGATPLQPAHVTAIGRMLHRMGLTRRLVQKVHIEIMGTAPQPYGVCAYVSLNFLWELANQVSVNHWKYDFPPTGTKFVKRVLEKLQDPCFAYLDLFRPQYSLPLDKSSAVRSKSYWFEFSDVFAVLPRFYGSKLSFDTALHRFSNARDAYMTKLGVGEKNHMIKRDFVEFPSFTEDLIDIDSSSDDEGSHEVVVNRCAVKEACPEGRTLLCFDTTKTIYGNHNSEYVEHNVVEKNTVNVYFSTTTFEVRIHAVGAFECAGKAFSARHLYNKDFWCRTLVKGGGWERGGEVYDELGPRPAPWATFEDFESSCLKVIKVFEWLKLTKLSSI